MEWLNVVRKFVKSFVVIVATSCFLPGCLPDSNNPVADSPTAKVDPKPYISKDWLYVQPRVKNSKRRPDYMEIYKDKNTLKVLFSGDTKKRPQELRLTRVGNHVIASFERFHVERTSPARWDIFKVTIRENGSKMIVEPLKEEVVREHVKKKILKGKIHILSWDARTKEESAQIQATGQELRQYIQTKAVFEGKIEFVKVARRN